MTLKKYYAKLTNKLFDGHDALFHRTIEGIEVFGEYGAGASTKWLYANTSVHILSVDTSKEWVDRVRETGPDDPRLDIQWIDVGPLRDWGRPKTYAQRDQFSAYVESIWKRSRKPEMVLVDGRFRVSCFLYSLAHGAPGMNILFDDYTTRPEYHVVEEFVKPTETCGRQACFCVPNAIDRDAVLELQQAFQMVCD